MLSKDNRLKKKKDFEKVFNQGKSYKGRFFSAKVLKTDLKESRFGFIVSGKVSKKAVIRNKIRRLLQEAVRKNFPDIKKIVDVAIVAFPQIQNETREEIQKSVSDFLKKTGLV